MSVISSRIESISSILKSPGARSSLIGAQKKITFKLPPDLKDILIHVETHKNVTKFEDLQNIIRHSQMKDEDFIRLLEIVRECIQVFKSAHRTFIEVLLDVEWRTCSLDVISLYNKFIDDLIDVHPRYYKFVIDKLIVKLKPTDDTKEWDGIEFPKEELEKYNQIHSIFKTFLKTRPMLTTFLIASLESAYPHTSAGVFVNKVYLLNLLQIIEYAPLLRRNILILIITRLTSLDNNVSSLDVQYYEEMEDMDQDINPEDAIDSNEILESMENRNKIENMKQLIHMLDINMEAMFSFVKQSCYESGKLNMDNLKSLFHDLLYCFEKIILRTHENRHVQFIMFYICSFKSSVLDAFVRFLWQKVSEPNTSPILRQYAVSYISSLLARSNTTPLSLLHEVISDMTNWIHAYIQQDSSQSVNNDVRRHNVFYAICQALFYLIAFRHRELTDGKKNLLFLQNLQLSRIVSCQLNPLKVCQQAVVQNFAAVTRNYQLAYCNTIIERNRRAHLPVLSCNTDSPLQTFFPFDPYLLKLSKHRITDIYYTCQSNTIIVSEPINIKSTNSEFDYDEDFMEDSFLQDNDLNNSLEKFSYGSSPGFCKNIIKL